MGFCLPSWDQWLGRGRSRRLAGGPSAVGLGVSRGSAGRGGGGGTGAGWGGGAGCWGFGLGCAGRGFACPFSFLWVGVGVSPSLRERRGVGWCVWGVSLVHPVRRQTSRGAGKSGLRCVVGWRGVVCVLRGAVRGGRALRGRCERRRPYCRGRAVGAGRCKGSRTGDLGGGGARGRRRGDRAVLGGCSVAEGVFWA